MKNTTRTGLACFAVIAIMFVAFGAELPTRSQAAFVMDAILPPPVDMPIVVELPTPTITLPTQVITLTHVKPGPVTKVEPQWVCGAPHTMDQGPLNATVRDCGWR